MEVALQLVEPVQRGPVRVAERLPEVVAAGQVAHARQARTRPFVVVLELSHLLGVVGPARTDEREQLRLLGCKMLLELAAESGERLAQLDHRGALLAVRAHDLLEQGIQPW